MVAFVPALFGNVRDDTNANWWQRWRARAAEKTAAEKVELERLRRAHHRRVVTKKIADGLSKRLKRRSNLWFWVIMGSSVLTIKYVCDQGGLGCKGKDEGED